VSPGAVPVILQARMGSRRLPGKVLSEIAGRPLIEHCIDRLVRASVGPVILATTDQPADDGLVRLAERFGIRVCRGPEDDVLQRFGLVADYLDARFFIRATADNPAVDIDAPARVVAAIESAGADHVVEAGLPVGAAVEAVRTAALYQAVAQARTPYDREHVTPFLYRNPGRFLALRPDAPPPLRRPDVRLTVDTSADLAFMRQVLSRAAAKGEPASLAAIIAAADEIGREVRVD
jgi:spore coat polysaccharide biosynthesis protein SpsF